MIKYGRCTIAILFIGLLSCNSDKPELITQFNEKIVESASQNDDFYGNAEMERWFLAGPGKAVGFLRLNSPSPYPKFSNGHYVVTADLNLQNQQARVLFNSNLDMHFSLAYGAFPSIVAVGNDYNRPYFMRSIDGGNTWSDFYRGEDAQFYFTDFSFSNYQLFDEYSGVMGINTFVGAEFYSITEGKAEYYSKLEEFYIDDLEFTSRFRGWLLCRSATRLLPSDVENSFLLSTSDGGKTWSDTFLIDTTWAYDKLIVLDDKNILIWHGHTLRHTADGGKTWTGGSNLNYNVVKGKNGVLYRLNKEKDYRDDYYYTNSYYYELERSFDMGDTWGLFGDGLIFGDSPFMSFDEYGQGLISFKSGEVFVSNDEGRNWTQVKETNVRY